MNKREITLTVLCAVFASTTLLMIVCHIDAGSRMQAMRRTIATQKENAEAVALESQQAAEKADRSLAELKARLDEVTKAKPPPRGEPAVSEEAKAPAYTIVKQDRCDMGRVKRLSVWVLVVEGMPRADVERVIAAVVDAYRHMHAVSVFVSRTGDPIGAYTVAMGEWAPGGVWADAIEGLNDPERRTYRTKVSWRD